MSDEAITAKMEKSAALLRQILAEASSAPALPARLPAPVRPSGLASALNVDDSFLDDQA